MKKAGLKIIITGSTGMVGEGVLHECLLSYQVSEVLLINRKPVAIEHHKIKEILHHDMSDLSALQRYLTGYDACFYCLGTTSAGKTESEYFKVTYELTVSMAALLSQNSPETAFCYVSAAGTDITEKGRVMWARVKGKTENVLRKMPFDEFYALRPGFLLPTRGLSKTHAFYRYISWLYPVGRLFYPTGFCTQKELGRAMITLAIAGYDKHIVKGKDIIILSR